MSASREAYDLFYPACRENFRRRLRHGSTWRRWWFWKLVASDTYHRVCSRRPR